MSERLQCPEDDMHIKAVDADLTLGGDGLTSRLATHCMERLPIMSGVYGMILAHTKQAELARTARSVSDAMAAVCSHGAASGYEHDCIVMTCA